MAENHSASHYYELAQWLDQCERSVTSWEADFLEAVLRRGAAQHFTSKQQGVLREMGEKYLSEEVMLEFNGQQRLW